MAYPNRLVKVVSPFDYDFLEEATGVFSNKESINIKVKANEPFKLPLDLAIAHVRSSPGKYQFVDKKLNDLAAKPAEEDPAVLTVTKKNPRLDELEGLYGSILTHIKENGFVSIDEFVGIETVIFGESQVTPADIEKLAKNDSGEDENPEEPKKKEPKGDKPEDKDDNQKEAADALDGPGEFDAEAYLLANEPHTGDSLNALDKEKLVAIANELDLKGNPSGWKPETLVTSILKALV